VPVVREAGSVGTDAKVLLCSAKGPWGCLGTWVAGTQRSRVPWLGWQGLTQVPLAVAGLCRRPGGISRMVLCGLSFPGPLPQGWDLQGTKSAGVPSQRPKLFRDLRAVLLMPQ